MARTSRTVGLIRRRDAARAMPNGSKPPTRSESDDSPPACPNWRARDGDILSSQRRDVGATPNIQKRSSTDLGRYALIQGPRRSGTSFAVQRVCDRIFLPDAAVWRWSVRAKDVDSERLFTRPVEWDDFVSYLERRRRVGDASDAADRLENRMTIVIIEDDGAMRALLEDVLERAGHRVLALADGTRLAALVENEPFDAVILDKEMPGPNGLDLLTFLRHRSPDVPVIFITAFGGRNVADEAVRRGAYSYIEKPFRVGTILDAVEAVPRYRIGAAPVPRGWSRRTLHGRAPGSAPISDARGESTGDPPGA